ncbi:hypothetical protein M078_0579 [Bacteroides fragilis str. 2-F-2 |nr:hypothetical protein M078_0579 [Bacteroides fragilis str. 2-F-2 \
MGLWQICSVFSIACAEKARKGEQVYIGCLLHNGIGLEFIYKYNVFYKE